MVRQHKLTIKEAFDSSVPNWLKKTLHQVARPERTRYGTRQAAIHNQIDLNTAKYVPSPVPVNARDPKWSDEIIIPVFKGTDAYGNPFVWIKGYNNPEIAVPDARSKYYSHRSIDKVAKSTVLSMCDEFGYFVKGDGSDNVVNKRKARTDARAGAVDRDRSKAQYKSTYNGTWNTYSGYDKSGYKLDPGKYAEMLADMNLSKHETIMNDAIAVATECIQIMSVIRQNYTNSDDRRRLLSTVSNWINRINSYFSDLDNYYASWQRELDHGLDYDDSFYKDGAISAIKDLRAVTKKAAKFIQLVKETAPSDEIIRMSW